MPKIVHINTVKKFAEKNETQNLFSGFTDLGDAISDV